MTSHGRGYDSYPTDEAKRQARGDDSAKDGDLVVESGRTVGTDVIERGDLLFGRPGSINELIRTGLVAATPVALIVLVAEPTACLPAFGVVFVVTLVAVIGADWLARPYRGWATEGLIVGLTSASLFLALLLLGLMTVLLFVMRPGIDGVYAAMAVTYFTLLVAVPASLFWLVWGLFRRGRAEVAATPPTWRLSLAPLVILGDLILFARVGGRL